VGHTRPSQVWRENWLAKGQWISLLLHDVSILVSSSLSKFIPEEDHKYSAIFLIRHHLIESVHLGTRRGGANTQLHPALALVLTAPGREYFVLRDTGISIGTSDEGLEPLWQGLIGCDTWGYVNV
jgi:hypothetical protein